jgi:hypothetical protein
MPDGDELEAGKSTIHSTPGSHRDNSSTEDRDDEGLFRSSSTVQEAVPQRRKAHTGLTVIEVEEDAPLLATFDDASDSIRGRSRLGGIGSIGCASLTSTLLQYRLNHLRKSSHELHSLYFSGQNL